MRMSFRVTLGVLLAAMLSTLLAIGITAGPATASVPRSATVQSARGQAASVPAGGAWSGGSQSGTVHLASVHPAGLAQGARAAAPTTSVTASPTTDFNKGQQDANAALAKRKLVVGIICVVLLLIVYVGRRAKGKHILRVKNLQNAKS